MLNLRAQAAGEETLQRIQDIVTADLGRFGKRDHLAVTWQRSARTTPRSPGW
jgi:hypothetical protein